MLDSGMETDGLLEPRDILWCVNVDCPPPSGMTDPLRRILETDM